MALLPVDCWTVAALKTFAEQNSSQDAQRKIILKVRYHVNGLKYLEAVPKSAIHMTLTELFLSLLGYSSYNLKSAVAVLKERNILQLLTPNDANRPVVTQAYRTLNDEKIAHHNQAWISRLFPVEPLPLVEVAPRRNPPPVRQDDFCDTNTTKTGAVDGLTVEQMPVFTGVQALLQDLLKAIFATKLVGAGDIQRYRGHLKEAETCKQKYLPADLKIPLFDYVSALIESLARSLDTKFKVDYRKQHYVFDKASNVIHLPGDGNCLYHTFALGLKFITGQEYTVAGLREQAARYFEQNYNTDGHLYGHIQNAIMAQNFDLEKAFKEQISNLFAAITFEFRQMHERAPETIAQIDALNMKLAALRAVSTSLTDFSEANLQEKLLKPIMEAQSFLFERVLNSKLTNALNALPPDKKKETLKKRRRINDLKREVQSKKSQFSVLSQIEARFPQYIRDVAVQDAQFRHLITILGTLRTSFTQIRQESLGRIIDCTDQARAIQRYATFTRQDRYWGSYPEIIALAKSYNLDVMISAVHPRDGVRRNDDAAVRFLSPEGTPLVAHPIGRIHLDYENRNHWNLNVEPNR